MTPAIAEHMIARELSRRLKSMNGIPRPSITATPAADPNQDRDPIPFGYGAQPYVQHPQPQSYVPHQIAPESFTPSIATQQPSIFSQMPNQAQSAPQQQPQPQPQAAQPQPAQQQYATHGFTENRQVSPELALAIAGVTGLSAEDCSAAIDLIRDITKLLPPQHAQRVAFLLVSIAVELDHK